MAVADPIAAARAARLRYVSERKASAKDKKMKTY